jgi:uncharacterized protein YodC (DUF2158 family)
MPFKRGDVVRLKSGGPPMTVDEKGQYGDELVCHWFDGKTPMSREFAPDLLERCEPDRPATEPFVPRPPRPSDGR